MSKGWTGKVIVDGWVCDEWGGFGGPVFFGLGGFTTFLSIMQQDYCFILKKMRIITEKEHLYVGLKVG